jgi:hypothetical protein
MSVKNVLNTAIYNKLTGGTALITALGGTAIYYQQAEDQAEKPFVVWSYQAGGDENDTANRTKNLVVLVRSFADTSKQAGEIDKLVDDLLHLQPLTVTGWTNFWLARESEVSLIENLPNVEKSYMEGALYRVRLDQN